jgi:hypothetical protein
MKRILFYITGLYFLSIGCNQANHDKNDLFNQAASISSADTLPLNPLEWKVITSFINTKNKTMGTLYGNYKAFYYASHHAENNYPEGSILALVTWHQVSDKHWFGANIPGAIRSVELLQFETSTSNLPKPLYTKYEGHPLKLRTEDKTEISKRTIFIMKQKKSVIPG